MQQLQQGSDQADIQQAFPDQFKNFVPIGRGSYAKVYKAENMDNELVAIKVVDIQSMQKEIIPYMESEMKLLSESDNKNSHQTAKKLFLVLEYCFLDVEFMVKRYFKGKLPDQLVITILRQLANGLSYLHKRRIIHRDLKLENFAVQLSKEDQESLSLRNDLSVFERATYKLIDLGLAKQLSDKHGFTSTWAGTELTMAPEILCEQEYSFEADMYSLGVCLYYMVVGKYPYFDPTNRTPLQDLIKRENADLSLIHNQQLKELIKGMLRYDPKERLTFVQLYDHEFLKFKPGDLQSPLDLELNENQIIYTQKRPEPQVFERKSDLVIQQIQQYQPPQQQYQQQSDLSQNNDEFQQVKLDLDQNRMQLLQNGQKKSKLYDPGQRENDQIMQLYNIRNQYTAILKLTEYLEQLVQTVQGTKLEFMTMKSKFGMYIDYLKMVAKQLVLKLQQRFKFYEPTLGSFDRFKLLVQTVMRHDLDRLANIQIKEGSSTGLLAQLKKTVFKSINCEPYDSLNFSNQYETNNKELYQELLKMVQDTYYKFQDAATLEQKIKRIKCLLYLSMINTARSRVLFTVQVQNVDYKQEELLLTNARDEPDILQDKITTILQQYNLNYD